MKRAGSLLVVLLAVMLTCLVATSSGQTRMLAEISGDVSTSFGSYHPYPALFTPRVPPLAVESDFSDVQSMPSSISPADSVLLIANHFVVRKSPYSQIYDLYNQCTQDGTPVFITSDAVLHTYHVLFDRFLRNLEAGLFFGKVDRLTASLLNGTAGPSSPWSPSSSGIWQSAIPCRP